MTRQNNTTRYNMTKGKSKSPAKITRGLEDWFANTLSSNDFLQGKVISAPSINNTWGAYDPNINPRLLYEASLDPTVVGITTALENSVFKKGWYVESEEYDEDSLRDTLNEIGYFDAMKKLYSAWLRSDGNALLIKQQRDNGVYIRVEPFVTEGYQRVRVVSNPYTREITSYKIFSHTGSEIEEIENTPLKVYHARFIDAGTDYRWGTSPLSTALPYFNTKKMILSYTQNAYLNGTNVQRLLSLPVDMLKMVVDANGVITDEGSILLNMFSKKMSDASGLTNSSKTAIIPFPVKVDDTSFKAADMEQQQMLSYLDSQFSRAFVFALSNLGETKSANYSTSEQNRENLEELTSEPVQKKFEEIGSRWALPIFADVFGAKVYFGKENTEQDLEEARIKQEKINSYITNLTSLIQAGVQVSPNEEGIELLESMGFVLQSPTKLAELPSSDSLSTEENLIQDENQQPIQEATSTKERSVDDSIGKVLESATYTKIYNKIAQALDKQKKTV